jgi:hypothetical protein
MRSTGLGILFFFIWITTGCNSNADKYSEETGMDMDSAARAYAECYENFFEDLPKFNDSSSAILNLESTRKISITQFFKEEYMSPVAQYGLKDLDGDGVTELIIYNNSGGAHCCDEYYIFSQTGEKEFDFKSHLMGSGACISASTNTISFSFSETLGYFFACYACGFTDSSANFKPMRGITLQFKNGNLAVVPYSSAEEKQNITNLQVLKNHGYEKVEGMMDNGWRKEYAMNLAVWHYNHGKNWDRTKKLFDQYYVFEDADKVWNEFYHTLKESEKENTF